MGFGRNPTCFTNSSFCPAKTKTHKYQREELFPALSCYMRRLVESRDVMIPACRFLATCGGRVDIDKETGLAVYKRRSGAATGWTKLSPGLSFRETLFNTGVTGSPQVRKGGKLMILTSVSYLIIQVSSELWSPGLVFDRAFIGQCTAFDFWTNPGGCTAWWKEAGVGVASDTCGGALLKTARTCALVERDPHHALSLSIAAFSNRPLLNFLPFPSPFGGIGGVRCPEKLLAYQLP